MHWLLNFIAFLFFLFLTLGSYSRAVSHFANQLNHFSTMQEKALIIRHCGPYLMARENLLSGYRWLIKTFPSQKAAYRAAYNELSENLERRFSRYHCRSPKQCGFIFFTRAKRSNYPEWPLVNSWSGLKVGG